MKITIGLAQIGEEVYVCAGRDEEEVKTAFKAALPHEQPVQMTIGTVKVGRVYLNLNKEVALHAH